MLVIPQVRSSQIAYKSSDQTTTSASAVNITEMVFPVLANKKYFIRGVFRYGVNTANGVKFAIDIPAGATMYVSGLSRIATSDTARWGVYVTDATLGNAVSTVNNAFAAIYWEGTVTIGVTAGNVQFQVASATGGDTTTVYAEGTVLECIQLN